MGTPKHIVAGAAFITNQAGKVLLVESPRRGWESPGGQVEEGENLIEALQREILEETGIAASIGALVGIYSNIKLPTKLMFSFLGQQISGELHTSNESLQTEWVERDEVLQRITRPAIHDRMRDMLKFSGHVIYRVYTTEPYVVHQQLQF